MAVVVYGSGPKKGNRIVVYDNEVDDRLDNGFISDEAWQELLKQERKKSQEYLENLKLAKKAEIEAAYQSVLLANITAQENPTQMDVAIAAAIVGGTDADGLEFVADLHCKRKNELLYAVEQAGSAAEVEAVQVKFLV